MRKLQQAMIAAAVAAGGLSAIGAGAGTAYAHGHGHDSVPQAAEHYRPYQECSPQTVAEGDLPIGVLGLSETFDTTCGQFNNAFTG
jgi:Flp pilus assembly protein CpaB